MSVTNYLDKLKDIERRVSYMERLDVNPPVSAVPKYSGTPTAGNYAYWSGPGTVADSGFGTSQLPRYSGTPAGSALAYWTGNGTVAAAGSAIWDNSNRRLGINVAAPTVALDVLGATNITNSASAMQLTRTSSSTTLLRALAGFLFSTSGSSADGCGPAFFFQLADAESPSGNTIGEIGAERAGADNSGNMVVAPVSSGVVLAGFRALAAGNFAMGLASVNANVLGIIAGTSSNDAAVGGVLYVDSGTHANSGTGETDLAVYVGDVPANTLAVNNQMLEFEAWITLTNNANTKTIKFKWGGTVVTLPNVSGAASTLHVRGYVIRTGAATQDVFVSANLTGNAPVETFTTATETLSGSVVMKFTGQSNTASNDVKQEFFRVVWADSNT